MTNPVPQGRTSDHVLIDVPEPSVAHGSPTSDSTGRAAAEPAVAVPLG